MSSSIPSIIVNNENENKMQAPPAGLQIGAKGGPKGFLKKMGGGQSFCSPTDGMVSPCTQKLVQSKQRHYTKGKPLSLSSSFQATQSPPSNSSASNNVNQHAFKPKSNLSSSTVQPEDDVDMAL